MKLLFLHPNIPDYVGDSLFHGLSLMQGVQVLDVPRMDYMYYDFSAIKWQGIANEGKTLYGLLLDDAAKVKERLLWLEQIERFDYIVINNPQGFGKQLLTLIDQFKARNSAHKIVLVDGSDSKALYPFIFFSNTLKKYPKALFLPFKNWLYFKREIDASKKNAPGIFNQFTKNYNVYPISISIPKHHIEKISWQNKSQDFPGYIVDDEIAGKTGKTFGKLGKRNFIFNTEEGYFNDIRLTRFGITTRRAGWDALRHYEYAAKGAILCFKHLNKKPLSCSPHGLNLSNCIIYQNHEDLNAQLKALSEQQLLELQLNSYEWVEKHTTEAEALRFIKAIETSFFKVHA